MKVFSSKGFFRTAEPARLTAPPDDAVAIVGMSCRFAEIATPGALWDAVLARRPLLTPPGPDADVPPGAKRLFDRPYPARIGQLGDLYACVPLMQNFPRQVNAGENQDLYFATQLAFDALADASLKPHPRTGLKGTVRLGYAPPFNASTVGWLQHTTFLEQTLDVVRRCMPLLRSDEVEGLRAKLAESLPTPDAARFLLGAGYRVASWIARECGFEGAATILDAGLLTGAVTLQEALDDLTRHRADVALVGALTPPFSRAYLEGLAGEVPFSQLPELHPFAETSDGTLPGEGGAFFVLKRRADALRDRDRIYALVRAVAVGHASADEPERILADALAAAGVAPATVGLIEADGSGIAAAERREVAAIQRLWGEHKPGAPLVGIGSVKGNVGHTLRAAMSAGLAKTALALYHRVLPPQVAPEHPLETLANLTSSAYLLTEARPWISGDSANPRRAAVLGANFDAVRPVDNTAKAGRAAAIILEEEPEDRA